MTTHHTNGSTIYKVNTQHPMRAHYYAGKGEWIETTYRQSMLRLPEVYDTKVEVLYQTYQAKRLDREMAKHLYT